MTNSVMTKSQMISKIAELSEANYKLEQIIKTWSEFMFDETDEPLKLNIEDTIKVLTGVKLSIKNHEETIAQNRDLQSEIKTKNDKLAELEKRPFFPYPMNDGNMADFGEFYLVSHAWFHSLNESRQIGIIEIQTKSTDERKIYLGMSKGLSDFKQDVLNIAQYGSKIKG